jgi:hypothetical protein
MQPATSHDGPAARAELEEQLARRRLAMRLLGALLAGLWTGLAIVVLVAYRPGGPLDIVAGLTVALPAIVTAASIPWPPVSRVWKRQAAIAWLGLVAAMLVGPLVGIVVTQLVSGGGRTLLPSPEVAYAAVLAAGASALFASLGVVAARDGRLDPEGPEAVLERRPSVFAATALGLVLTTVIGVLFGASVQLNELALREEPLPPSRFGPTDATLANPLCDTPLSIGPGASLEITAQAFVDDEPVGSAFLTGQRSGTDEQWTGSADGPSGPVVTGYIRTGDQAWRQADGRWVPTEPDPYGLLGVNQLTVDGPVAVAIVRPENPPVAEDVGLELIEGAKARHCRTAIDGPTALDMLVPLRWIAGSDPVEVTATLPAWRGTLDWWVFADGQLGMAQVVINGYPGDAWKTSGLQGEIHAELRAIDRAFAHSVQAPPEALLPGPTVLPIRSPVSTGRPAGPSPSVVPSSVVLSSPSPPALASPTAPASSSSTP